MLHNKKLFSQYFTIFLLIALIHNTNKGAAREETNKTDIAFQNRDAKYLFSRLQKGDVPTESFKQSILELEKRIGYISHTYLTTAPDRTYGKTISTFNDPDSKSNSTQTYEELVEQATTGINMLTLDQESETIKNVKECKRKIEKYKNLLQTRSYKYSDKKKLEEKLAIKTTELKKHKRNIEKSITDTLITEKTFLNQVHQIMFRQCKSSPSDQPNYTRSQKKLLEAIKTGSEFWFNRYMAQDTKNSVVPIYTIDLDEEKKIIQDISLLDLEINLILLQNKTVLDRRHTTFNEMEERAKIEIIASLFAKSQNHDDLKQVERIAKQHVQKKIAHEKSERLKQKIKKTNLPNDMKKIMMEEADKLQTDEEQVSNEQEQKRITNKIIFILQGKIKFDSECYFQSIEELAVHIARTKQCNLLDLQRNPTCFSDKIGFIFDNDNRHMKLYAGNIADYAIVYNHPQRLAAALDQGVYPTEAGFAAFEQNKLQQTFYLHTICGCKSYKKGSSDIKTRKMYQHKLDAIQKILDNDCKKAVTLPVDEIDYSTFCATPNDFDEYPSEDDTHEGSTFFPTK